MKFSGAIFDLDGTLLDSMWVWRVVDDTYIRSKGMIPEPDLSRKLATKNMSQSVEYFQEAYGINEPAEKMAADLWALAEQAYREKVPLKEGVKSFLERLHDAQIPCVIATASDKDFSIAALKRCGVWQYFDGIITCDEIGSGKDRPDVFYHAQKMLGTPTEETIVFEDSLHAILTAKKAGFPVVAVEEKYSLPDMEAILQNADKYLKTLDEWHFEEEIG